MSTKLRVGTRGSALALRQTREITDMLLRRHPGLTFELVEITTHGDRFQDVPIADIAREVGTPAYVSPEQWRDCTSIDHRSDLYSLGCTFFEILTGRPPFEGKS